MSTHAYPLHIVTDAEADLLMRRHRAWERFLTRYPAGESRRAMKGALDRVAGTFSGGVFSGATFPWDTLVADDLAREVWQPTATHYASATARRDASAIRMILQAYWREGLLTHEQYKLATSFELGKLDWTPSPGRSLTDDEVARLIEYDRPGAPQSLKLRDRALMYLMASTGARRSELHHVGLGHVDFHRNEVLLEVTKNSVSRVAWLHPAAADGLEAWFDVRGSIRGNALLALSRTGRPLAGRPLSAHQMWKILTVRSEAAGIGRVTPHDMRRFVVTRLLEEGHDLLLVSRLVGHSDPSITALYDKRPAEACRLAVSTLPLPSV